MLKNIIIAILLAVAVWSVSLLNRIYWVKTHILLALGLAILGALIIFAILAWKKKTELADANFALRMLLVAAGAAVGITIGTLVVTCIPVSVDCAPQTPTATPDEVTAYMSDSICWKPGNDNYTVTFKQSNVYGAGNGGRQSPIKKLSSNEQEVSVRVLAAGSPQIRIVDVSGDYYWYEIKCDNGHKVDPKVRVPPR